MRTSLPIAILAGLALLPGVCAAQKIHLEAGTARLSGPNLRVVGAPPPGGSEAPATDPGSEYISGFIDASDRAVFQADSQAGGLYRLALAYRSKAHKGYDVEVNGLGMSGMLDATEGSGFVLETVATVELKAGQNEIAINKGWGHYELEYIELTPAGTLVPLVRPAAAASDSHATAEARQLLTRLDDSYGKTTLLGVYKDRDAAYVLESTGVRPGIMGGDLLAYSPQLVAHGSHPERAAEVERLIARAQEGYVITLSWHWGSPSGIMDTKEKPWWRGFYTDSTTFDIAQAMADTGSSDHAALLSDIDAIAVQLRKLQDAHVPVLWRPLHEAEGGWFWWGAKGPKPFVQLWQMLYERLQKDGIHNLIWVFTSGGDAAWYPGDAYVDVVGIDAYPRDLRDPQGALWDELSKQYAGRKPLAISEFGGVPDIPRMQRMGEYWSYAVSWSDREGPKKNAPEELKRIYQSSGVGTQPAAVAETPSSGGVQK